MSTHQNAPKPTSSGAPDDQREDLERAERDAAKKNPQNFQDTGRDRKVVSTDQSSASDVGSIQGIDNDPSKPGRKQAGGDRS